MPAAASSTAAAPCAGSDPYLRLFRDRRSIFAGLRLVSGAPHVPAPRTSKSLKTSRAAAIFWPGKARSMIVPEPRRGGGFASPGSGGGPCACRSGNGAPWCRRAARLGRTRQHCPPLIPPTVLKPPLAPGGFCSVARPYSPELPENRELHRPAGGGSGGDLNGVADVDGRLACRASGPAAAGFEPGQIGHGDASRFCRRKSTSIGCGHPGQRRSRLRRRRLWQARRKLRSVLRALWPGP